MSEDVDKCRHEKTVYEECLDCHWNAAIEAAAEIVKDIEGSSYWAEQIRELKK